jgi:hypothetical protein
MRRGLMAWDPEEIPERTLRDRIARLRSAMQRHGLDALLLYTNLVRPSAVSYLTAFTPYWSDGLLLVPRSGDPVFATALSKRVASWIRSVNPIAEIVNTPRPGGFVAERLAADETARTVGVLELDGLPAGLYDDIIRSAPRLELVDGSAAFTEARRPLDSSEAKLLAHADMLARAALQAAASAGGGEVGTVVGAAERAVRLGGGEEAYVAIARDLEASPTFVRMSGPAPLGSSYALRVSVAYKGAWVRRIKSISFDPVRQHSFVQADRWLDEILSGMKTDRPIAGQLKQRIRHGADAQVVSWMAETCIGSYPLEAVASSADRTNSAFPDRTFLVMSLHMRLAGRPWLGGGPVIQITPPREQSQLRD